MHFYDKSLCFHASCKTICLLSNETWAMPPTVSKENHLLQLVFPQPEIKACLMLQEEREELAAPVEPMQGSWLELPVQ